jgi:hypothetical protein
MNLLVPLALSMTHSVDTALILHESPSLPNAPHPFLSPADTVVLYIACMTPLLDRRYASHPAVIQLAAEIELVMSHVEYYYESKNA